MNRSFPPVAVAACCLFAVCASQEGAQAALKNLNFAFVSNNTSDFWTIARAGTTKAAEELGSVTVQFKIPEDETGATQTRILDDLLFAGIDGIAISPLDPKAKTPRQNRFIKGASDPRTGVSPGSPRLRDQSQQPGGALR